MAFPLTHLCVAEKLIFNLPKLSEMKKTVANEEKLAQFVLGTIAPDAIHYRKEYLGANMLDTKSQIGFAKKNTHLCPNSEERWGFITDNAGWEKIVKNFVQKHHNNYFALGYAVHALTDIYNNMSIWNEFGTNHPEEALKGYTSDYYKEMKNIDLTIYHNYFKDSYVRDLLLKSIPCEQFSLVTAEEVTAIKNNLLHEAYKDAPEPKEMKYVFVSYDRVIKYIDETVNYIIGILDV